MKLEQQVTSLELAKKLKELGVKQESLFWWLEKQSGVPSIPNEWILVPSDCIDTSIALGIPAYTVAELGELLPFSVFVKGKVWELKQNKNSEGTKFGITGYAWQGGAVVIEMISADTEADARAKCLVYLIENKLITL